MRIESTAVQVHKNRSVIHVLASKQGQGLDRTTVLVAILRVPGATSAFATPLEAATSSGSDGFVAA